MARAPEEPRPPEIPAAVAQFMARVVARGQRREAAEAAARQAEAAAVNQREEAPDARQT